MATYNITAFAPTDAANLTNPGPAGAFPVTGDEYRLRPDWSNSTHARTITVTDDDGTLSGDPTESGAEDTSQQTAVVTDAGGATIASGFVFAEYAFLVEGPDSTTLTVYSLYVGNTLVGYAADGPVQPGANYLVTGSYQPNGGMAPSYASFDPQTYEQSSDNTATGTARQDSFEGGAGADTIAAEDGNDTLRGGAGNDSLDGGRGNDQLFGDGGDDTLVGGAGDDTITTGTGEDVVVVTRLGSNDTITDFDIGDTDGDGRSNDQLDVSALRDTNGNPVNFSDVVVSDDGLGNAVLTFPEGETITLQGISPAQMTSSQMMASGIPCYAPGTLIETPDGPRSAEALLPGDMVMTLDHGPQAIRWVRRCDQHLEAVETGAKPILIAAGALGGMLPAQDLIVSPQHRILVGGRRQLQGQFETEVFAPAKSLTKLKGIRQMKGKSKITWIHFACDRHEVVTANGCLSESLLLGPMVVNRLPPDELRKLINIFGLPPSPDAALNGPPARHCLTVDMAKRQIAKHLKDERQLMVQEIRKWNCDLAMEKYEFERLRKAS